MSVNLSQRTPQSSITSCESLFLSYKKLENLEISSCLEKSMFFLSHDEKKLLRAELKNNNHKLEFLLLKNRNNPNKGFISLEINKFLKNLKKTQEKPKNKLLFIKKAVHNKHFSTIKTEITLETKENISLFESPYKASKELRKILVNSNENKINLPFQKKSGSFSQKNEKVHTEFEEILKIFLIDNEKMLNFLCSDTYADLSSEKERLKSNFLKEKDFILEIPKSLKMENAENAISAIFSGKNLFKISNTFFRFKMEAFLQKNLEEEQKKLFLDRLFEFCDLKKDGLLEINEIGLAFQLIFNRTTSEITHPLQKFWLFLDKKNKNFVTKEGLFSFLAQNQRKSSLLTKIWSCETDNKGFVTYWDLFLREIQENDLLETAQNSLNFIG